MAFERRELERSVVIACAPSGDRVVARLIAALGPEGLTVARRQALDVLEHRSTKRTRDVLRTLDAIDDALHAIAEQRTIS